MKVGIIGYGYVGKAVASVYGDVLYYDPAYQEGSHSINELKQQCEVIFVCVPTPSDKNGSCDSQILTETIAHLTGFTGLVISKSTAIPQVYSDLQARYPEMKLAHVPEFLTTENAEMDYQYPVNIVIGCRQDIRQDVFSAIITDKVHFDYTKVKFCNIAEAAMFKYLANTMLAMKVVINNEYYELCNSLGISWNAITKIAENDPRLGDTHWKVPGPDGSHGFGGTCLTKDTLAIQSLAKFLNVDMSMLNSALVKNSVLRTK